MRGDGKSQREKMPCQGRSSSPQTCVCAASQQARVSLQRLAPEAIPAPQPTLFRPLTAHQGHAFDAKPVAIRPIPPPDQPPRL